MKNFEGIFNKFIIENDGCLIADLLGNSFNAENADYFFRNKKVIAELKCFEEDIFNRKEDVDRILKFFQDWKKRKLIKDGDELKIILKNKKIPEECYNDLFNSAMKTVERVIHKANKQIKSTKQLLEKGDSVGLIFLCNTGNYFLQNIDYLHTIQNIARRKFKNSHFDCIVYLTCNQKSITELGGTEWQIWVPFYTNPENEKLSEFVDELGSKFKEYWEKVSGTTFKTSLKLESDEQSFDFISKMRYKR